MDSLNNYIHFIQEAEAQMHDAHGLDKYRPA